jgi:hypothetical protein
LPSSIRFYDPYKKTPPESDIDTDTDTEFEWMFLKCFMESWLSFCYCLIVYRFSFSYPGLIEELPKLLDQISDATIKT